MQITVQLNNNKHVTVRVVKVIDNEIKVNCDDVSLCAAFRGQAIVIEPHCLTLFTNRNYAVSVKTHKERLFKSSLDNINQLWMWVMFGKADFAVDDVDVCVDSYSPDKTVEIYIPEDAKVLNSQYVQLRFETDDCV